MTFWCYLINITYPPVLYLTHPPSFLFLSNLIYFIWHKPNSSTWYSFYLLRGYFWIPLAISWAYMMLWYILHVIPHKVVFNLYIINIFLWLKSLFCSQAPRLGFITERQSLQRCILMLSVILLPCLSSIEETSYFSMAKACTVNLYLAYAWPILKPCACVPLTL